MGKLVLVLACVAACVDDPTLGADEQFGVSLNGVSLNGVSLDGVSLNGVSINGAVQGGLAVHGVALSGNQITEVTANGTKLSGTGVVGTTFTATTTTGGTMLLRIDGASLLANGAWAYQVSVNGAALCGSASVLAIPIPGRWDTRSDVAGAGGWIADPSAFTFACRGMGAIAKCVDLGYKPWTSVSGQSLQPYHQACVRMIRGDYCGNGHAWTHDGNQINVYDKLGIQKDTQLLWPVDAEWTADGARCILIDRAFLLLPSCYLQKVNALCGNFNHGALLVNEYLLNL